MRGDPTLLADPQLAIVGSRNATPGGRELTRELAARLAACGLVITSGLALGVDGADPSVLDRLAPYPFWRKVVQRLPQFIRPSAAFYGHAVAFDDTGTIRASLEDPSGQVHTVTGVLETPGRST